MCEGGVFADYINTFFKLRLRLVGTRTGFEALKTRISTICISMREGVQLDRATIRPDAAKRGLAKLFLNSLGVSLQRENRTQTKLISDPHDLYSFIAAPGIEVVNLFASDTVVWASWRYTAEEQVPSLRDTNEVIVACGSRMQLYSYIDSLGE